MKLTFVLDYEKGVVIDFEESTTNEQERLRLCLDAIECLELLADDLTSEVVDANPGKSAVELLETLKRARR